VCNLQTYEGVSESFRTESIMRYKLTRINTRWETTQRVMAAKLTRLTHKIAIQLHLVAESCTICSCRSRLPVGKLLDTPSYTMVTPLYEKLLQFCFKDTVFRICFMLSTKFVIEVTACSSWFTVIKLKLMYLFMLRDKSCTIIMYMIISFTLSLFLFFI
jgi:hypothetical protein